MSLVPLFLSLLLLWAVALPIFVVAFAWALSALRPAKTVASAHAPQPRRRSAAADRPRSRVRGACVAPRGLLHASTRGRRG